MAFNEVRLLFYRIAQLWESITTPWLKLEPVSATKMYAKEYSSAIYNL